MPKQAGDTTGTLPLLAGGGSCDGDSKGDCWTWRRKAQYGGQCDVCGYKVKQDGIERLAQVESAIIDGKEITTVCLVHCWKRWRRAKHGHGAQPCKALGCATWLNAIVTERANATGADSDDSPAAGAASAAPAWIMPATMHDPIAAQAVQHLADHVNGLMLQVMTLTAELRDLESRVARVEPDSD
jgi:hypothetical protein